MISTLSPERKNLDPLLRELKILHSRHAHELSDDTTGCEYQCEDGEERSTSKKRYGIGYNNSSQIHSGLHDVGAVLCMNRNQENMKYG